MCETLRNTWEDPITHERMVRAHGNVTCLGFLDNYHRYSTGTYAEQAGLLSIASFRSSLTTTTDSSPSGAIEEI